MAAARLAVPRVPRLLGRILVQADRRATSSGGAPGSCNRSAAPPECAPSLSKLPARFPGPPGRIEFYQADTRARRPARKSNQIARLEAGELVGRKAGGRPRCWSVSSALRGFINLPTNPARSRPPAQRPLDQVLMCLGRALERVWRSTAAAAAVAVEPKTSRIARASRWSSRVPAVRVHLPQSGQLFHQPRRSSIIAPCKPSAAEFVEALNQLVCLARRSCRNSATRQSRRATSSQAARPSATPGAESAT